MADIPSDMNALPPMPPNTSVSSDNNDSQPQSVLPLALPPDDADTLESLGTGRVNLIRYAQQVGEPMLEFAKENWKNEQKNSLNTKAFYLQIVEGCKNSRKNRDRMKNLHADWEQLVNKQNQEINDFNPKITAYNTQVTTPLTGDQAAIDDLNAAINQFNLDGNSAALQTAIDAYNAHFATANVGIQTYDDAATAFNLQVDENNQKIDELNELRAKLNMAALPHQSYATLAGQVPPYPPAPLTNIPPLAQLPLRATFTTFTTYPDPPPFTALEQQLVDQTQKIDIEHLIFSRQMLNKQDNFIDFFKFKLRGKTPQLPDDYAHKKPEPKSGGGETSTIGLGGMLTNTSTVSTMLEDQLSLVNLEAALSTYDKLPPVAGQIIKSEYTTVAFQLIKQTALLSGNTLDEKTGALISKLRAGNEVQPLVIANEFVKNALQVTDDKELLAAISKEIVEGALDGTKVSPDVIANLQKDVELALANAVVQFALQEAAISLGAPGLVGQVLATSLPQYAPTFTGPSQLDLLNQDFKENGGLKEQIKNEIIQKVVQSQHQGTTKEITTEVDKLVDEIAKRGPYPNLEAFRKTVEEALVNGLTPTVQPVSTQPVVAPVEAPVPLVDTTVRPVVSQVSVPSAPSTPTTPAISAAQIPSETQKLKPLPITPATAAKVSEDVLAFIINLIPLSDVRASDLDKPAQVALIKPDTFIDTGAGRRITEGTKTEVTIPVLREALKTVIATPEVATVRDVRNVVVKSAQEQGLDLDTAVVLANRLANELVNQRITQGNISASQLNEAVFKEELLRSLAREGLPDARAVEAVQNIAKEAQATTQRLNSEDVLRSFIKDYLVKNNILESEKAQEVALTVPITLPRAPEQIFADIGVKQLLPEQRLSEELISYIVRRVAHQVGAEKAQELATDFVNNIVGKPVDPNLVDRRDLSNPLSLLRVIKDSNFYYTQSDKQAVVEEKAAEFRSRMNPTISSYTFNEMLRDPARLLVNSKWTSIQQTKDQPSFQRTIDIVI